MNKCHENGSTGLGYTIWADYSCDGLSTAGWEPNNSMFCSVLLHANSKPSWLNEIQIPLRINSVTKKFLGAFPGKKQLTGLPAKELCSFASVLFLNKLRHITQPNTVMEVLEILDQRGSYHLQHLKKKNETVRCFRWLTWASLNPRWEPFVLSGMLMLPNSKLLNSLILLAPDKVPTLNDQIGSALSYPLLVFAAWCKSLCLWTCVNQSAFWVLRTPTVWPPCPSLLFLLLSL